MGSMSNVGIDGSNGDGMGGTDEDSGSSVLQSMGYVDSGADIGREDGDASRSVSSILQTVVILAVVGFFGISVLYLLLSVVLSLFGVQI